MLLLHDTLTMLTGDMLGVQATRVCTLVHCHHMHTSQLPTHTNHVSLPMGACHWHLRCTLHDYQHTATVFQDGGITSLSFVCISTCVSVLQWLPLTQSGALFFKGISTHIRCLQLYLLTTGSWGNSKLSATWHEWMLLSLSCGCRRWHICPLCCTCRSWSNMFAHLWMCNARVTMSHYAVVAMTIEIMHMCCECDVQWRLMQRIFKLLSHLFINDFEVNVFRKLQKHDWVENSETVVASFRRLC